MQQNGSAGRKLVGLHGSAVGHVRRAALWLTVPLSALLFATPAAADHLPAWFGSAASDFTTTNALSYSSAATQGPEIDPATGNYIWTYDEKVGPSTSEVVRENIATVRATTAYGRLEGYAITYAGLANSYPLMETRDVWTVTGGSGVGTVTVKGHIEGTVVGGHAGLEPFMQLHSIGAPGSAFIQTMGSVRVSFFAWGSPPTITSISCAPEPYRSECTTSIDGNRVRLDWTITVPFEYGGRLYMQSAMGGHAGTGGYSMGSQDSVSTIDSIELPEGATLSAASQPMHFYNNAWHYVPASVGSTPADLSIMFADLTQLRYDQIRIPVTISNLGPGYAKATMYVPTTSVYSVTPSAGCTIGSRPRDLTCVATLAPGTQRTYLIVYDALVCLEGRKGPPAKTATINGSVSAVEPDPILANNSATRSYQLQGRSCAAAPK